MRIGACQHRQAASLQLGGDATRRAIRRLLIPGIGVSGKRAWINEGGLRIGNRDRRAGGKGRPPQNPDDLGIPPGQVGLGGGNGHAAGQGEKQVRRRTTGKFLRVRPVGIGGRVCAQTRVPWRGRISLARRAQQQRAHARRHTSPLPHCAGPHHEAMCSGEGARSNQFSAQLCRLKRVHSVLPRSLWPPTWSSSTRATAGASSTPARRTRSGESASHTISRSGPRAHAENGGEKPFCGAPANPPEAVMPPLA